MSFDTQLVLQITHPQLAPDRYEYAVQCALDLESHRWNITLDPFGHRVFFDGSEVIELRSRKAKSLEGREQFVTNAIVHHQYAGIPLSMNREPLATWFAYAAGPVLKANEGRPFPNLHGEYLYDLNSHCCLVTSKWTTPPALVPQTVVFRYSRRAIEAMSAYFSDELISDNPEGQKVLRQNYLSLAKEGEIYGEFTVKEWLQAAGTAFPKVWEYDVKLLGSPSLRFSGRILGGVEEISAKEFDALMTFDARDFHSVTDYRFLAVGGVDKVRYDPQLANSSRLLATSDPFFASLVQKKAAEIAVWKSDAAAGNPKSGRRLAIILMLITTTLLAAATLGRNKRRAK